MKYNFGIKHVFFLCMFEPFLMFSNNIYLIASPSPPIYIYTHTYPPHAQYELPHLYGAFAVKI
jgi:hypothetical protein